jgi:hypothetical protein
MATAMATGLVMAMEMVAVTVTATAKATVTATVTAMEMALGTGTATLTAIGILAFTNTTKPLRCLNGLVVLANANKSADPRVHGWPGERLF